MAYMPAPGDELLEVLACDLSARPAGAPGPAELAPYLLGWTREAGALTMRFAAAGASTLAQFVAAERLCCADIGWSLLEGAEPALRIDASESRLDAFAALAGLS